MRNKPSRSEVTEFSFDASLRAVREECAGELEELCAKYVADYEPDTGDERIIVVGLAYCEWQQRCLEKVEAQIRKEIEKAEGSQTPLGKDDLMWIEQSLAAGRRERHQTTDQWERLLEARKAARRPAFNLADMPDASRWRM